MRKVLVILSIFLMTALAFAQDRSVDLNMVKEAKFGAQRDITLSTFLEEKFANTTWAVENAPRGGGALITFTGNFKDSNAPLKAVFSVDGNRRDVRIYDFVCDTCAIKNFDDFLDDLKSK